VLSIAVEDRSRVAFSPGRREWNDYLLEKYSPVGGKEFQKEPGAYFGDW
jgi:hypothetical protein